MTTTRVARLAKKIFATGIHGVTGQQIDEGYLMPGTLVKNIREHGEYEDGTIYRFEACTDGQCWFTQESYSRPEVSYSQPEVA